MFLLARVALSPFALSVVAASLGAAEPIRGAPGSTDRQRRPMIVAHRGLLRHAPENTLPAFRTCLELRFGFELDVRRARDGQLVCVHDASVDRTTNRSGKLADLTWEELQDLDAGAWFDPGFTGVPVPSLDQVFALLAKYPPGTGLIAVDLKDADVEKDVVALATERGVLERVIFIGRAIENPDVRRALKEADPKPRVAWLAGSREALPAVLQDPDVDWAYVRFLPSAAQVQQIHRAGKQVFLAGPLVAGHEPENWRAAAQAGVDAVLTDYPLELAEVLRNCCAAEAALPRVRPQPRPAAGLPPKRNCSSGCRIRSGATATRFRRSVKHWTCLKERSNWLSSGSRSARTIARRGKMRRRCSYSRIPVGAIRASALSTERSIRRPTLRDHK